MTHDRTFERHPYRELCNVHDSQRLQLDRFDRSTVLHGRTRLRQRYLRRMWSFCQDIAWKGRPVIDPRVGDNSKSKQRRSFWENMLLGFAKLGSSGAMLLIASTIGLIGFFSPLLLPLNQRPGADTNAHSGDAPLLFALVTICSLIVMMVVISDDHGGVARSKTIALLGVLVAIDATLRVVPSFLGASPVFFLIILVGAVFGSAIGFQMGTLTILLSAFLTGGIGPWLPFQMLCAGWIGMSAGWLPRSPSIRQRMIVLAVFGCLWGFLFGLLMNLWFWPFATPGSMQDAGLYWSPGLAAGETFTRYLRFYVVTSLGFDTFRAVGNVVLIVLFGGPVLRLLERYRSRFAWQPWTSAAASPERQVRATPID